MGMMKCPVLFCLFELSEYARRFDHIRSLQLVPSDKYAGARLSRHFLCGWLHHMPSSLPLLDANKETGITLDAAPT